MEIPADPLIPHFMSIVELHNILIILWSFMSCALLLVLEANSFCAQNNSRRYNVGKLNFYTLCARRSRRADRKEFMEDTE